MNWSEFSGIYFAKISNILLQSSLGIAKDFLNDSEAARVCILVLVLSTTYSVIYLYLELLEVLNYLSIIKLHRYFPWNKSGLDFCFSWKDKKVTWGICYDLASL